MCEREGGGGQSRGGCNMLCTHRSFLLLPALLSAGRLLHKYLRTAGAAGAHAFGRMCQGVTWGCMHCCALLRAFDYPFTPTAVCSELAQHTDSP